MCGPEASRRARGFSLVELMVGIVVALLIALAALASAQAFMGRQRQALDAGSASANVLTSLAALQYELSHAGIGFFAGGSLLCPTMNLSVGSAAKSNNAAFLPLQVTVAAAVTTLDVRYASALEAGAPSRLGAATTSGAASSALASLLPVAAGQQVMLVPAAGSSRPCTVRTATSVTAATDVAPMSVATSASGVNNQYAFTSVSYGTDDWVTVLGNLQWAQFKLTAGSDLVLLRPLTSSADVAIAHNVKAFQAQYGVSDGVSNTLTGWVAPTGDWASLDTAHLARVRAVRVGLVVRSDQPEKKDAAGLCNATVDSPLLFDAPVTISDTDWQCYRYRVETIVVPLRNFIWGTAG